MSTAQSSLPVSANEVLRARYLGRMPASLEELVGPAHGIVSLPLHVAWSGLTAFDLDSPKARMSLYRIVLAEGQREDLARYLNQELLVSQWRDLRSLISRSIRDAWEFSFPELSDTRS
jgi:hypothetical protein